MNPSLPTPHQLYLLLGANLGDCAGTFRRAATLVARRVGAVVAQSAHYQTAPWGVTDQPAYLNQVLWVETHLSPLAVLAQTQAIEAELGRVRAEKWGARLIDVDLLFYDDLVLDSPTLTIPHPLLHERRFTLAPLSELNPDLWHPLLNQSVGTLLATCPDPGAVVKVLTTSR